MLRRLMFQSASKEANVQPEEPRNSRGCKKSEKCPFFMRLRQARWL